MADDGEGSICMFCNAAVGADGEICVRCAPQPTADKTREWTEEEQSDYLDALDKLSGEDFCDIGGEG